MENGAQGLVLLFPETALKRLKEVLETVSARQDQARGAENKARQTLTESGGRLLRHDAESRGAAQSVPGGAPEFQQVAAQAPWRWGSPGTKLGGRTASLREKCWVPGPWTPAWALITVERGRGDQKRARAHGCSPPASSAGGSRGDPDGFDVAMAALELEAGRT